MTRLDFYRDLAQESQSRILFTVLDGLGGLPHPRTGLTELEAASTPVLDALAREGECGLTTPILPGVTPGSGPAHLALFGYDPVRYQMGRGVLESLGVGFDLGPGDVAARINFCTLDGAGNISDRRAGRIPDEVGRPLVQRLDALVPAAGVDCSVRHVKQYRACVVFKGEGLAGHITDTDPQRTGVPPLPPRALDAESVRMAEIAAVFVDLALEALADQPAANGLTLRGFDDFRPLPEFAELYRLSAGAVAAYPMYLGAARLAGMSIYRAKDDPAELLSKVRGASGHDFVFLHYKSTDSRGEDGDFDAKVAEIERADGLLGELVDDFEVVMVTGDHSTPWSMRAHSWHPVPVLIRSASCRRQAVSGFGEQSCASGSLGRVRSMDLLPLVLAHAGKLRKFGA